MHYLKRGYNPLLTGITDEFRRSLSSEGKHLGGQSDAENEAKKWQRIDSDFSKFQIDVNEIIT